MRLRYLGLMTLVMASVVNAAPLRNAGEVSISNHTNSTLSFTINNVCSNDIGDVYSYSIKTISQATLLKVCGGNLCRIEGYDQPNCLGNTVGGEELSFENGEIVSMSMFNGKIDYLGGGSIGPDGNAIFFNDNSKKR